MRSARTQRRGAETFCGDLGSLDRGRADMRSEVPELGFRIDDDRRHELEGFFDNSAQRGALSCTARSLDQEPACKELIEIEFQRTAGMFPDRYSVPDRYFVGFHVVILSIISRYLIAV